MKIHLPPLLILLSTTFLFAQKNSLEFENEILTNEYIDKTDVKTEFIKYDISSLLTQTRNDRVFGFIGDNYQRIRIKFISVIRNKENPSQYFVYGKSMVKENVCEFQGTITITKVFNFKVTDIPGIKQGKVVGEYLLFENPSQKHVGQFRGIFSSNWYLDKDGNLKYDDLSDVADGFTNNEFVGTWTSYSGTIIKACNWGDHRIPMSGDLDDGAGEFHPSDQYQANGWLTFQQAYGGGYDTEKIDRARKLELMEWWK
ncbi:MAG TPA: hypothetical protein VGD33_00150 [Chitinophagaceae bacterium]